MSSQGNRNNIGESARPERKASKRLAADLLRFESAFDKLERGCMGLGAIHSSDDRDTGVPEIAERDVQAYLGCLDEAIRQLAEEFSADATMAGAIKKRDVTERDAAERDAIMPIAGSPSQMESAPQPQGTLPRKPNCASFDGRSIDASPIAPMFSQVDTSAV
jgi:hypothetical protein